MLRLFIILNFIIELKIYNCIEILKLWLKVKLRDKKYNNFKFNDEFEVLNPYLYRLNKKENDS